jgi:[protein-PII] uridylyltransferase
MWHARRRIDAQFRRNPVNRHMFIQILQQPRGVMRALRSMSMLNILPRYLPVFRRIVGQMQHDLFHAYTVDQHILMVIRNLRRFTIAEHSLEYPLASRLIASFDRHWLLYVAALFHDIAKGRGGDHSELGAQEARRFCRDHGLEGEDAALIEFLVRQHLTMSMVAQKRDISDPSVVNDFARCVGNERRLTALYLLTVADIRATSPRVWNSWKGKLLEDLYLLTAAALGEAPSDTSTVLAQRRNTAIAQIRQAGIEDKSRGELWRELDVAYFLRHEADEIAWHAVHIAPYVRSSVPIVKARTIGRDEALQIMVYVQDREDLFVTICRYFDERILSVQDARVHTTQHGWALDSFIVLLPAYEQQYDLLASHIEEDLARELQQNSHTPRSRLGSESPRRSSSRRARAFPMVPKVELQRDDSNPYWRLAVTAADGPGLLYRLAKVFAAHRINLKMAKIMTLGDRVEDVFIIEGEVLGNPRVQLQFERDILVTLDNALSPDAGMHP